MKTNKLFFCRNLICIIIAVAGMTLCIGFAAECTEGIRNGILFCIEALVPALFLPMVLSSYIINSGIAEWLSKMLNGVSRRLFRLPPQGLTVILLSAVGGYPVGARCAAMMAERGALSESEAQKTAIIAVCAGPGFLLNFVGEALLHNIKAGSLMLAAELISVIITGVIIGYTIKTEPSQNDQKPAYIRKDLLIGAVTDASRASFHMCGMVIVCAAAVEIIARIVPAGWIADVIAASIEITTGCSRMCGVYPLPLIAFFIGFGGISVHLQIHAGAGSLRLHKGLFLLFRLIQGITAFAAAYILLMIFPIEQRVFNSTDAPLTAAKSATLCGSAALVLSSLCFLGNIHQKQLRR